MVNFKQIAFLFACLILAVCRYIFPDKDMEIITFMAVVVALFRERLIIFLLPPKLKISLAESPDHFAKVDIRDQNDSHICFHASMGIIVENIGLTTAKNVMVFLTVLNQMLFIILVDIVQFQCL